MSNNFPYVQIREEHRAMIGEEDPGTKIFRREGSDIESGEWFSYICENISQQNVSPGGWLCSLQYRGLPYTRG